MMKQPGFEYPTGELREFIHSISGQTVINSRLAEHGDYETPEQFIPVFPTNGPWELCMTSNNTWSFTGREENYKTPYEIIAMFCECLGMGGNLLLNIGPDEHGVVPPQQVALLETLGDWVHKHAESVPGTLWIDVPAMAADEFVTVLKIELEGPLNLYGGEGVEIDAN